MNTALMEYQEDSKSLSEYLVIFKRRRWHFLIASAAVFIVAALLALSWPATYRSTATILIEEQEIPREMVQSTITSFAAQRIQVITQRIMTVDTITDIVERLGLYQPEEGDAMPPRTALAERFSSDMALDLVSAEVIDPRSGRATEATIAFTLSFESENPLTAQNVANELVTLYLNENLRTRAEKAESTAAFIGAEASALNDELLKLETELSQFKEINEGSLPELYQYNLSTVERTDNELSIVTRRLQELEKRKIEIASELTRLPKTAPVLLPTGEMVLSDADRLRALQSEYRNKATLYHNSHPDMVSLREEIQLLKATMQGDGTGERAADNPAYVLLQNQLKSLEAEKVALLGQQKDLQEKKTRFENYILKAPEVEKDYQALLRDYNNATAKYQELKAKQREAELAENLELERKSERFVLVEPPLLPLDPISPNRQAIIFLGLILAAAAGVGIAILADVMDDAIYGEKQLGAVVGSPPLVVIPYLNNSQDFERRSRQIKRLLIAVAVTGLVFVIYMHFFVKPLDVIFFMILNKLA